METVYFIILASTQKEHQIIDFSTRQIYPHGRIKRSNLILSPIQSISEVLNLISSLLKWINSVPFIIEANLDPEKYDPAKQENFIADKIYSPSEVKSMLDNYLLLK